MNCAAMCLGTGNLACLCELLLAVTTVLHLILMADGVLDGDVFLVLACRHLCHHMGLMRTNTPVGNGCGLGPR